MQQALDEIEHGTELDYIGTGIEYRGRCAIIHSDATEDLIDEQISRLDDVEQVLPFALGDLFLAKQTLFNRTPDEIAHKHGYSSSQTVKDRMSVSRRIPHQNRIYNLSYSVYRAVTKFEPDEQRYWLEKAQREGLRTWELRSDIKSINGEPSTTPLRFPESPSKSRHDIDPLPALGSAAGGGDYLVDRQDEAGNSFRNYANARDNGETDMSYAIGNHADRLSQESDLQDDIEQLNQELANYKMANEELATRLKNAREAMADLQENHRKAVERLEAENEELRAKLEANQGNLYQVLEKNVEAYDPYLLDKLLQANVITQEQHNELIALRHDVSFDETVDEVVYVNEEF
jgi:hypothetical protein